MRNITKSMTAAVFTVGLLGSGSPAETLATASSSAPDVRYTFRELNNAQSPGFNQLRGINNSGKIAGYCRSGVKGLPIKGYILLPPYHQADYRSQNFPRSRQTEVTGLSNTDIQVGFYSTTNTASRVDNNFGYYSIKGTRFVKVNFPTSHPATPPVDQLLGVNDSDVAVGFYTDHKGNNHGYTYNIRTHRYSAFNPHIKGEISVTATGINDSGTIVGFFTDPFGAVHGFLVSKASPHLLVLHVRDSSSTTPFGINKFGEVVGSYTTGKGRSMRSFGFTWSRGHGFQTISDPQGVGTTVVEGVNSKGDLVGFYTDKRGHTNGMLATPGFMSVRRTEGSHGFIISARVVSIWPPAINPDRYRSVCSVAW